MSQGEKRVKLDAEGSGERKIFVDLDDEEKIEDVNKETKCDDSKAQKLSSPAWDYFKIIKGCEVGHEKAQCQLCKVIIGCNTIRNGTSAMMSHLRKVCPTSKLRINLDKNQKSLQLEKISNEDMKLGDKSHTIRSHMFNQERFRKKLVMMCIKDNQPFNIVEHEGFRELLNEAEPKFKMPSRWTVERDCLKIYKDELMKLKKCLISQRISFTTDTWTSIQNINYVCLTAHWVNDEWKLCKRILNFRQIGSHKGVAIGKLLVDLFA